MNIVIIAYRPDFTDYCRGCRMGSTESDMQYNVSDTYEDAAEFLAKFMAKNITMDSYDYAPYEFSYIINGSDEDEWYNGGEEYEIFNRLRKMATTKMDVIVAQHEKLAAEKKLVEKHKEDERIKQQELKTLARLQEKHGT